MLNRLRYFGRLGWLYLAVLASCCLSPAFGMLVDEVEADIVGHKVRIRAGSLGEMEWDAMMKSIRTAVEEWTDVQFEVPTLKDVGKPASAPGR